MNNWLIGLTGPTGAGKSVAAAIFAEEGCAVIDADKVARAVTQEDADCLRQLAGAFGADILREDGTLNRRLLASRAFATHEGERRLNAITHPPIMRRIHKLTEEYFSNGAPLVVLDAPLLFESGSDGQCAATVAVLAAQKTRLARIMARDGLTEEEALLRINAQPADEYYRSRADYTLYNDGQTQQFAAQVHALIDLLRAEGRR